MNASPDTAALLAHVGWVRGLARELVADAAEAEDVAQDALVSALEHPPREPGAWPAYLRALLRNAFLQRRRSGERRAVRERAGARAEALPSAADSVERLAVHREVVAAVEALDEPYRQTVLLRYFDELPPREIAARLSVPVKTVNTRLHRAHALLRQRLDDGRGGDRRAWALALAALVRPEPSPVFPRLALGSLGLVVAVAIGFWVVRAVPRSDPLATRTDGAGFSEATVPSEGLDSAASSGSRETIEAPERRVEMRGRVRTAAGEGIAGAEVDVRFRPADGMGLRLGAFGAAAEEIGRVRSGADGRFALTVPEGRSFDVRVRAEGYGVLHRPLVAGDGELDLVLAKAGTLAFEVRDPRGTPVEGAAIELCPFGVPEPVREPWIAGRADATGRWTSTEVPPGVYSPSIRGPNGPPLQLLNVAARSGEVVEREVRLPYGSVIEGSVRAAGTDSRSFEATGKLQGPDGAPIAGAWVGAYAEREGMQGERDWVEARSDHDGSFTLAALRPDLPHALLVRSPGSATTIACLPDPGTGAQVDLGRVRIEAGGGIEGRVRRDDGSPAAGAIVVARRMDGPASAGIAESSPTTVVVQISRQGESEPAPVAEDRTVPACLLETFAIAGDDGRFALRDLARGRYRVQARIGWLRSQRREIDLAAGAKEIDLSFEIARGLSIDGSIVDDEGRPLPGAWALLIRDGEHLETRSEVADEEGRFRMEGLQDGRFRIDAGYQSSSASGDREHPYASTKVLDVVPPRSGVVIRLPRTIRVEGRVVDAAGKPLAHAIVNVRDQEGRSLQAISDAGGRFRVEVVPAAVLDLEGSCPEPGADAQGSRRLEGKLTGVAAVSGEIVLRLE